MMHPQRSRLVEPELADVLGAVMVIVVASLIATPSRVAVTVNWITPPEFPAVNVAEAPVMPDMLPSVLFSVHV